MKKILLPILLMLFLGCKTSSQISKPPVILITQDGSLISEDQLAHSSLRIYPPLVATVIQDTIILSLDVSKIGTTPSPSAIPRFQKFEATAGQTFFPALIPNVYFVTKNGLIMDLNTHYTVSSNGITFTSPSKSKDIIKVIRLE